MSTPCTPLFQKTLVNGSQHPITKIEVWNGYTFLAELGHLTQGAVTAGIVDIDETRSVRRLLTNLLIESMGRPADQVIPALQNDLLHPASGNEIRVYRGFIYSDGTEEFVPMGVFRISKPVVIDKIGELNVTVNGNDRSAWVSRIKWQAPYVITAGTDLATAVQALINDRVPGLTYNLALTTGLYNVPATTFGASPSGGTNDPWADVTSLATAAGMELFFDVNGIVVMRPIVTPTVNQPSFSAYPPFVEGANCTVSEYDRTFDETLECNGVIVVGNGSGGASGSPPVQAVAWDTDPSSPTYYLGSWGKVPSFYVTDLIPGSGQSNADAIAQAQVVANAQLQLVCRSLDTPVVNALSNPALCEGDVVQLTRQRMGLNGLYVVSKLTTPLVSGGSGGTSSSTNMVGTMRPGISI